MTKLDSQSSLHEKYGAQAYKLYGKTPEYQEMLTKTHSRTHAQNEDVHAAFMDLFARLGR